MKSSELITKTVPAERTGARLDVYLRDEFTELSRAKGKELFERGAVRVNNRRVAPSYRVQAGDVVTLLVAPQVVQAAAELAAGLTLEVLYEDEHLCIVEKPFKVHSVRLHPEDPPTVADALVAYRSEFLSASTDPREGGLLQRLDYYTTGVLLAAKTTAARTLLRELFQRDQVQKSYLVLAEGAVRGRRKITRALSSAGERMRWEGGEGWEPPENQAGHSAGLPAETRINPLRVCEEGGRCYSVVRAEMTRGQRHQVRAHLASERAPLIGDHVYGAKTTFANYPHLAAQLALGSGEGDFSEGFFLNAERIRFIHPYTGVRVDVRSTHRAARTLGSQSSEMSHVKA